MSHPRDPRHRRGRHLTAAPAPTPAPVGEYVAGGQAPDYLAGAVRAELLADDWRAEFRAAAVEVPGDPDRILAAWDAGAAARAADDAPPVMIDRGPVEPTCAAGEWAEVEAVSDRDFTDTAPPTDALGRVGDWVSNHDPRSLEFGVRSKLNARAPIQDRLWPHGPIFDQGTTPPLPVKDASGCTGYAMTAAVNVLRPDLGLAAGDAFDLYLAAQRRDSVPGEAYAGTSVLAVAQEAQARGWIDAYAWAFGVGDVAQALLQIGPVVLGLPWLSQMAVDSDGILTPGGDRGGIGHAICATGIVRQVAGRPGPWFQLQQSYGPAAGVGGLLYLSADHLRLLLRGVGEACVPIIAGKG